MTMLDVVMIRRVLISAFSCRPHTVSWPGSPTLGCCFEAASLHHKIKGLFSYQGSTKMPQESLRLEICLESKADIITHRDSCLSSALRGDLICMYKVVGLGSCTSCVFFFLLVL